MSKIAILDTKQAYLPEIDAYIEYFNKKGLKMERIYNKENISEYDLLWEFSGFLPKSNSNIKVLHEYNSLSTGKYNNIKDFFKKNFNHKPDARIFLNQNVKETLGFLDNIPSINRDMGINKRFYQVKNDGIKEYDLVYIGTMEKNRNLNRLLNKIKEDMSLNIIMIGKPSDELFLEFNNIDNITFTGIVDYQSVPEIATKAKVGVNYIPNINPYNKQTSTKLLEYCAMNLNVLTTDYSWVNNFEHENHAKFLKLNKDLSNLTKTNIENFNFKTPDVRNYEWNNLLDKTDIENFILNILNEN